MSERHALAPPRRISTDVLEVAHYETGSEAGDTALLPHGFPYDIHSHVDVAPLPADSGFQVVIPYPRDLGPTGLPSGSTPRSGRQAAPGTDVAALMDALDVERACFDGYDRHGRAADVAVALWPGRVLGPVSVNSCLIQDIGATATPLAPEREAGFCYFSCFLTDRGRAGRPATPGRSHE